MQTALRYLLVGALVVVAILIIRAPARLLADALPDQSAARLVAPSGTIWRGAATLHLRALGGMQGYLDAGRVTWAFNPGALLRGRLGYTITLAGPDHALSGAVALAPSTLFLTLDGAADAAFINPWLAAYDMWLAGTFQLDGWSLHLPLAVSTDHTAVADAVRDHTALAGTLGWTGGNVRYRLSGRDFNIELPSLTGQLGPGPTGAVREADTGTPLLLFSITSAGFAKIELTQRFTELAATPWPGQAEPDAVVLAVEEQLFW
jgi:hypothetical protein